MTDRIAQAIAATVADLDWFKIPHTVDQLLGIYAESLGEGRPLSRRNLSNAECLKVIAARVGGRAGGHADPTAVAALAGEPDAIDDADGTVGAIDACLALMHEAAQELADLVADATGTARWMPQPAGPGRQDQLAVVSALLARLQPNLTAALSTMDADQLARAEELARIHLAESAAWLRLKGEEIWRASRGDHRPVAVQRPRLQCVDCARHGVQSDVAPSSRERCPRCLRFRKEYHVAPTAEIVRAWDMGRARLTPGMIAEAKARKGA